MSIVKSFIRYVSHKFNAYDEVDSSLLHSEVMLSLMDEETGLWVPQFRTSNQIMFYWGNVAARVFRGDTAYRPLGMYVEYKNVASPSDPVSIPSFTRYDGLGYYNTLPSNQDFLRLNLNSTPAISIYSGDETYFATGEGNKLTYEVTTSGTYGVQGRTFSNASNSKVFGAALVAYPVPGDRSRDLIFARTYFTSGNQIVKPSSGQVKVTWSISHR